MLLLAVMQVLVEGARWQMIPAYLFTGVLCLVPLLNSIAPVGQSTARKWTHQIAFGLAVSLGGLGLVVSIALPISLPVFHLPHPSGGHEIGTLTYHWIDTNRPEIFSTDPNARRELMVQIWYPAKGDPSSPRARYVQDADALAQGLARLYHWPRFTFAHLTYVTSDALSSAAVSDDMPVYPVLIFMEGLTGWRQMSSFQIEELTSHGYVVAAIDQPYTAAEVVFPDGRQVAGLSKDQTDLLIQQSVEPARAAPTLNGRVLNNGIIPYLAQDAVFTLDQLFELNKADPNGILTSRLDVQSAGIFGLSLGGITVSEACRLEPRFGACLVMDAPTPAEVVTAGLQQPTIWITRDTRTMQLEAWRQADIDQHQSSMRAAFESLRGDGYFVRVPGMFHANLTDIPYWSPLFPWIGVTGPLDKRRAHDIVNAYSLAFFDRHLKGRPGARLDGLASQHPEVLFETRQNTRGVNR
ncbi:MAG: alpha/beta hydrolase family protein [Chloroflexota bacterium]